MNKRYFNAHWREFFLDMTEEELFTIVSWVRGMQNASMWEPFVSHAVYELEVARMEAEDAPELPEEEQEFLERKETLH